METRIYAAPAVKGLIHNMLYKLSQCGVGSVYGVACKTGVRVEYIFKRYIL